jgi:hypothetical protein
VTMPPMVVRAIPGQEHLPWAEVWFRTPHEEAWREASRTARALGKSGLEVWTTEDHPDVVEFFAERGYEEVRRYLRFALDVDAAPDPGEPEWPLTTLAERPELLPQVYDVARETYVDQPGATMRRSVQSTSGARGATTRIRRRPSSSRSPARRSSDSGSLPWTATRPITR